MRLPTSLIIAGSLAVAAHAGAPDCATFPGDRARFACYDNVSRAPKPDPDVATKPAAAKPKPVTTGRKAVRNQ